MTVQQKAEAQGSIQVGEARDIKPLSPSPCSRECPLGTNVKAYVSLIAAGRFAEALAHPHNRARGTYVEVGGVAQPAPAPRFSATPAEVQAPPVGIGADTTALLESTGYSAEEIAALSSAGVV